MARPADQEGGHRSRRSPSRSCAAGSARSSRACPSRCRTCSSPATRSRPTRHGCGPAARSSRPSSTRFPTTWCSAARSCRPRRSSTLASARAAGIFRIQRQPVRTARSVHALADAIRRNAKGRLDAAKDLAAELDRHAATLGLTDDADRQVDLARAHRAARPSGRDHRRHADGPRARSRRSARRTTPSTTRTWTARNA